MKLPSYIRHFDIDRGIQYLMVGAAVVLISLLYPSSVKFKYEFQRGQEWRYADLYAPFDFPIQKSEEEVLKDRSELERSITPYYRFNKNLKSAKLKDCEAAIQRLQLLAVQRGDTLSVQQSADLYMNFVADVYTCLSSPFV